MGPITILSKQEIFRSTDPPVLGTDYLKIAVGPPLKGDAEPYVSIAGLSPHRLGMHIPPPLMQTLH